MTPGEWGFTLAGLLVVAVASADLFLTVFNYDGFTFIAGRYQRLCWRAVVAITRPLPGKSRRASRSLGSAMLLPATVALWLATEITGFALVYDAGLAHHGWHVTQRVPPGIGSAYYLSAGVISTLSFGDLIPSGSLYRVVVDLEAMVGLATFTLSLGYVVTTFSVLGDLDGLHNTVRRHARFPGRPSSILARHYRGGTPAELPDLLQTLSDRLESYDEGLRRYPIAFFFHTRRPERSIPHVFFSLGELLADLRWGLPPGDEMANDPWLSALLDQYISTVGRLQRSFVGPDPLPEATPAGREAFEDAYRRGMGEASVEAFREMQERTRRATGLAPPPDGGIDDSYSRYRDWFAFDHRGHAVLSAVATNLGYSEDDFTIRYERTG